MKAMVLAAAAAGAMAAAGGEAAGQAPAKIVIDAGASYDQALKCYRYYDVSQQVADALAAKVSGDAQRDQQSKSAANKVLKTAWNSDIELTKGKKTNKQVDDDLDKASGPIVADANANLGGDPAAKGRLEAVHAACAKFEKTQP